MSAALLVLFPLLVTARADDTVRIGYIGRSGDPAAARAGMSVAPQDEGIAGAGVALSDNNTTGRFVGHRFELIDGTGLDGEPGGRGNDPAGMLEALHDDGVRFVVANLAAEDLDTLLAHPAAPDMLIFNAGAPDDRFRNEDCRPFLFHTLPSRAMLADALAQYLVSKRWSRWFLVTGTQPADAHFADAVRRAAHRFGGVIVADKPWIGTFDARRTAVQEIPVFTQDVRYDVLIVADENGRFGDLFPYRTWDPRPVAGTQGLTAVAWHSTVEQWGAAQLQSRFRKQAGRSMTSADYAAWAAVRSIGEAATRTRATDRDAIAAELKSSDFALAAFKGRKVSYRAWDGQLRQPIPVVWAHALVTLSPQEGFLHPATELDTLGFDAPESKCKGFGAER